MRNRLAVGAALLAVLAIGCTNDPEGPFVGLDLVEPAAGSQLGGQRVIVQGSGFINGAATPNHVVFGEVLAETVTVISDTELEVVTPAALGEGLVDVTVFNSNGFTTVADGFSYHPTPVVTSLSPDQGLRSGGETVTITGSGFQANDAGDPIVLFGTTEATVESVVGDTEIQVTSPKGGLFRREDVIVTNDNGAANLTGGFQFIGNGLIAATGGGGSCGLSQSSQILFIDLDNGEVIELATTPGTSITGLAALDDTRVIALGGGLCCGDRPLFEVDITTGARTEIGLSKRGQDITTDGTMLFGYDRFGTNTYGTIDPTDATFTSIGGTISSGALAIADDGTHFLAQGSNLREIDPADGTVSEPPITMTGVFGNSAMAFHRGKLYIIGNQSLCFGGGGDLSLFEVDPATGAATVAATLQARVDALESADKVIGGQP